MKLYCGNCLKILPKIKTHSVDMILADLPYGQTSNNWDTVIPLRPLWKQYHRIIKNRGVVALFGQGAFSARLILSNIKHYKYSWIWVKSKATNFLNAKRQPLRKHEDVLIFYRHQPTYNPQMWQSSVYNKGIRKDSLTGSYGKFDPVDVKSTGSRYPVDVLYFKTAESEGKVYHPTQKPQNLLRYLIRTYTNPHDVILDNVMGSGSTGVACKRLHRKFIGIEINHHYFKIAKERIQNEK